MININNLIHSKAESKKEKANAEKETLSQLGLNSINDKNLGTICQNFNEKVKQTSTSFNFLNSKFLLDDRLNMLNNPVMTIKNDFSPSKGLTSEPFYSPIFDNNDSGKNSNSNYTSTPNSPNMEISNRICNFRTCEIFENDIDNKIIEPKIPNSNSKNSENKLNKWKGDLTFSSKKEKIKFKKKTNKTISHSQITEIQKEIFNYNFNLNSPPKKDFFPPEKTDQRNNFEDNLSVYVDINPLSIISIQPLNTLLLTEIKSHKCTCEKSKCKKKYCECFANGKKCAPDICKCINCENCENFDNGKINLLKNYTLFEEDEANKENTNLLNSKQNSFKNYKCKKIQLLNKIPSLNRNFCNCTHSKCNSRYCECFKNNRTCNSLCRCLKCINNEKHKNIYGNNETLQSFEHISVSIINNELSVYNYTEKIPILRKKNKRTNEKNNFNIFKSPHLNQCKTPLFTTSCETTASRKISNMDHIVDKINNDGKFVRRKIEMKKFNNKGMFDSNENKDEIASKNINEDE